MIDPVFSFNLADGSLSVSARRKDWRNSYNSSKTRIYVSLEDGDVMMEQPPFSSKGDDPANDKLWREYNRLEVVAMRSKIAKSIPAIAAASGYYIDISRLRFSRKAGCSSCPCSPGFIYAGDADFIDIWISAADTTAKRDEMARRFALRKLDEAQATLAQAQADYDAAVEKVLS